MNGTQICVSVPGKSSSAPNTTLGFPNITLTAATITSTAVVVPTNVAEQVNPRCGKYYQVTKGDYCNLLVMKYGVSLETFLFLNKAVNANCTNLLADESYCVQAVGDGKSIPV